MLYAELFLVLAVAMVVLGFMAVCLMNRELWLQSQLAGADVSLFKLVRLRYRGVPVRTLVDAHARTRNTSYPVTFNHYLNLYHRGGNPTRVSMALASAHAVRLPLDIDTLFDVELHQMDAFNYVQAEIQKQRNPSGGTRRIAGA